MSLTVWLDEDSMDDPHPKSKDKIKKLIAALLKERDWILKDMLNEVSASAESLITVVGQIGLAKEGQHPFWGSYGPAQGLLDHVHSQSGRFYEIEEVLDALYSLFPDLKPQVKTDVKQKGKKK